MDSRELFEILVRENQGLVRAFLLSAVRDAAVADDLLQEAFLIAWKNLDRYDRSLPFGPWVRGIAAKLVLTERRRYARSKVYFVDEEAIRHLERGNDDVHALAGDTLDEKLAALRTCMDGLTDYQRTTIRLHYEDGLQCKDIAPRLGLGLESVKKHLQRGRAALMRCIRGRLREQGVGAGEAHFRGAES
ncbi:MAG: sigma-70 family RNA polymerase sigma factor [Planctomycetes bacterium]|nr:sigma-70 family RNA polymerase sigma factor [Planctomycetota bacterium]